MLPNKILTKYTLGPLLLASLDYSKLERGKTDENRYSRMQANERKGKLKWIIVLCASKRPACTKRITYTTSSVWFTKHITSGLTLCILCGRCSFRMSKRALNYPHWYNSLLSFGECQRASRTSAFISFPIHCSRLSLLIQSCTITVVETTF
jgi:hypothetical protein